MGNTVGDMCCQLRSAAQNGQKEEAQRLIQAGAKVSCNDNLYQSTPLHEACRFGHDEVASLLLRHNVKVDALDCIGFTPLFYASKGEFCSIVLQLIEKGADVNIVSTKGRTALHCAVEHGSRISALILVEAGARLDVRDCEGRTPCQLAARSGVLKSLVVCRVIVENSKGALSLENVIDLSDEEIPCRARMLLETWNWASKFGKRFPVPPSKIYNAQSIAPLRNFLGLSDTGNECNERKTNSRKRGTCDVTIPHENPGTITKRRRRASGENIASDETDTGTDSEITQLRPLVSTQSIASTTSTTSTGSSVSPSVETTEKGAPCTNHDTNSRK